MDYISLFLTVDSWWQTITHGEKWPRHQFRLAARPRADEDLELVGGPDIRKLMVHLSVVRGRPEENPPERGIGILAYHPETPSRDDIGGTECFISGWFWMEADLYDEVWGQVRENNYTDCTVDIDIAPIEFETFTFKWDVGEKKVISINRAGVMFGRTLESPQPRLDSAPAPKKGSNLFRWKM